jgi:tight adherence protein B
MERLRPQGGLDRARPVTGTTVACLLACASVVLAFPRTVPRSRRQQPDTVLIGASGVRGVGVRIGRGPTGPKTADLHELPLFVHQIAGLLRAGRPPHVLWADLEVVYADRHSAFGDAALPVIATARRAAGLGLSIPDALRQAAGGSSDTRRRGWSSTHVDHLWIDLAGCLEVAERSGAPLAGILEHYAAQLDAQLDGLSARDTALAGPRATVVLLAWLPVVGLVLGFALGINPFEVLIGSALGRLALLTGAVLMVASRGWSRRLVQRAGGAP